LFININSQINPHSTNYNIYNNPDRETKNLKKSSNNSISNSNSNEYNNCQLNYNQQININNSQISSPLKKIRSNQSCSNLEDDLSNNNYFKNNSCNSNCNHSLKLNLSFDSFSSIIDEIIRDSEDLDEESKKKEIHCLDSNFSNLLVISNNVEDSEIKNKEKFRDKEIKSHIIHENNNINDNPLDDYENYIDIANDINETDTNLNPINNTFSNTNSDSNLNNINSNHNHYSLSHTNHTNRSLHEKVTSHIFNKGKEVKFNRFLNLK